mmetsp:Transcript_19851/g.51654  ORF Transcript_19851/g.51654 Transcript_19851/m.51654 type:complete len:85 (-) Transcript_19851:290-544(-)
MVPPPNPNKAQRSACYKARDAFYECYQRIRSAGGSEDTCTVLRKTYEGACPEAWVSHFDKKQVYRAFKQRLKDSEYQELKLEAN